MGLLCPWMSAPTPLLCSTGLQAPSLSGQRRQDPHGLCQARPKQSSPGGLEGVPGPRGRGCLTHFWSLINARPAGGGSADSTFYGRCRANALCPLLPPNNEVKRQETVMMVRVSGQRPRVRGGSEPRCWAGMWPALGGGERERGERRGLRPSTGPSPLTGTEPEFSLHRAERTAPDTELPRAPDTKVHLSHKPQAATTCCPAQLGRWGPQVGTGVKGGVTLPGPQRPAGSAERGGSLSPPHTSRRSRPLHQDRSGAQDFSCLLCSCHSSKGARSPSPRSGPSLNLPSLELPAGQLRQLRRWIRAGFT